jgi:hypothetical protein
MFAFMSGETNNFIDIRGCWFRYGGMESTLNYPIYLGRLLNQRVAF